MPDTLKGAARGRLAILGFVTLGVAAATVPAMADPIYVVDNARNATVKVVRVADISQPDSRQGRARLSNRIANAAEFVCGSDSRSLPDYRYAVRNSQCFHDSFAAAMQQLDARVADNGAVRVTRVALR